MVECDSKPKKWRNAVPEIWTFSLANGNIVSMLFFNRPFLSETIWNIHILKTLVIRSSSLVIHISVFFVFSQPHHISSLVKNPIFGGQICNLEFATSKKVFNPETEFQADWESILDLAKVCLGDYLFKKTNQISKENFLIRFCGFFKLPNQIWFSKHFHFVQYPSFLQLNIMLGWERHAYI